MPEIFCDFLFVLNFLIEIWLLSAWVNFSYTSHRVECCPLWSRDRPVKKSRSAQTRVSRRPQQIQYPFKMGRSFVAEDGKLATWVEDHRRVAINTELQWALGAHIATRRLGHLSLSSLAFAICRWNGITTARQIFVFWTARVPEIKLGWIGLSWS